MRFLLALLFIKYSLVNELFAAFSRAFRKHKSLIIISLQSFFVVMKINWRAENRPPQYKGTKISKSNEVF